MKSKKLKAYEYKTFAKARVHGYTKKQFQKSISAKSAWDNLSDLKKEIILDRLKENRQIIKIKKKIATEKAKIKNENLIEAYEIISQSHYDFRSKKVNSKFEYTLKGYFNNEPTPDKIEKIAKNSLIGAWNNGKKGNRYLKNSAFNKLVDGHIRGIKINKVYIDKNMVTNSASAELTIINNGNKWTGRN